MTTEQAKPPTPYQQRMRDVTAAVKAWIDNPDRSDNPAYQAQDLVSALADQDLQILPRCPSYAEWRVIVDGQPAPSINNPDRPSGPMDADEAAEALLLAARKAEDTQTELSVTVRPATDRELVAKLIGETALYPEPAVVRVSSWALLQQGDVPSLVFTDDAGTVIEVSFTPEKFRDFTSAMAAVFWLRDGGAPPPGTWTPPEATP